MTSCEVLNLKQNSIVQFNTHNNHDQTNSISINNHKFRESITPPQTDSVFLVEMKTGDYNISTDLQYDTQIHQGQLVSNYTYNDIKINQEYQIIKSLNFFLNNERNVDIIAKFVVDASNYDVVIDVNGKTYKYNNHISKSFVFSKTIWLEKGNHRIIMKVKSNKNTICSCPSKDRGYTNNNYLCAIIKPVKPLYIYNFPELSIHDAMAIASIGFLHSYKHYK